MSAMRVKTQGVSIRQSFQTAIGRIGRFVSGDEGVTAIEYGLIAALIAVVIIGAVTLVGTDLNAVFTTIGNDL